MAPPLLRLIERRTAPPALAGRSETLEPAT
jgi:hypothetical protein